MPRKRFTAPLARTPTVGSKESVSSTSSSESSTHKSNVVPKQAIARPPAEKVEQKSFEDVAIPSTSSGVGAPKILREKNSSNAGKAKVDRAPQKSLTDEQYESIFSSVIRTTPGSTPKAKEITPEVQGLIRVVDVTGSDLDDSDTESADFTLKIPESESSKDAPKKSLVEKKDSPVLKVSAPGVPTASGSGGRANIPTSANREQSKGFRGFSAADNLLSIRRLDFDSDLSSASEIPPASHSKLRTPIAHSRASKRSLDYDETPVSRNPRKKSKSSVSDDLSEDKENDAPLSQASTELSPFFRKPLSSSNSSSYKSAQSEPDRSIFTSKAPALASSQAESVASSSSQISSSQISSSQISSSQYSVAPSNLGPRERMEWLRDRRIVPTWVQCDGCSKWRKIENVHDPSVFPNRWYCTLNKTDPIRNNCEAKEERIPLKDADHMIYNSYAPGSLVWARVEGYPWWPAIVDDDPDYEMFYWFDDGATLVPTQYHVVFFDKPVSRSWVPNSCIVPFRRKDVVQKSDKYAKRLKYATMRAEEAQRMSDQLDRLKIFGFLAQYTGWVGDLAVKKMPAKKSDSAEKRTPKRQKSPAGRKTSSAKKRTPKRQSPAAGEKVENENSSSGSSSDI